MADRRFDAFISYRHVQPDQEVAQWLHRAIEAFPVPRSLVLRHRPAGRKFKLFIDHAELSASADLSQAIKSALNNSDALIVVCSPRTPSSKWVNAEIQHFIDEGRGDRVFAVLIEGEPDDSFPLALSHGGANRVEPSHSVEPLAADLRPHSHISERETRRRAVLKIVSGMIGCEYDQLRQRENERRLRRLAIVAATSVVLLLGALGLTTMAYLQRNRAIAAEGAAAELKDQVSNRLAQQFAIESSRRTEAGDVTTAIPFCQAAVETAVPNSLQQRAYLQQLAALLTHAAKPILLWGDGLRSTASAISDDSRLAAAAFGGKSVRVWELESAKEIAALEFDTQQLSQIAFLHGSKWLAVVARDITGRSGPSELTVWDIASSQRVAGPFRHTAREDIEDIVSAAKRDPHPDYVIPDAGRILCMALHPSKDLIATGGDDGQVRLWNASDNKSQPKVAHGHSRIESVYFRKDGSELWFLGELGDLTGLRTDGFDEIVSYSEVDCVSDNGEYVVLRKYADLDRPHLLSLEDEQAVPIARKYVRDCLVSNSGLVASSRTQKLIEIWHSSKTDEPLVEIRLPGDLDATALQFFQDGIRLAVKTTSSDHRLPSLRVFDARTGSQVGAPLTASEIQYLSHSGTEVALDDGVWTLVNTQIESVSFPVALDSYHSQPAAQVCVALDKEHGLNFLDSSSLDVDRIPEWTPGGLSLGDSHWCVSEDGTKVAACWELVGDSTEARCGVWSRTSGTWLWKNRIDREEYTGINRIRLSRTGRWLALETNGLSCPLKLIDANSGETAWQLTSDQGIPAAIAFDSMETLGVVTILKWSGSNRKPFAQTADLQSRKLIGDIIAISGDDPVLTSSNLVIVNSGDRGMVALKMPFELKSAKRLVGPSSRGFLATSPTTSTYVWGRGSAEITCWNSEPYQATCDAMIHPDRVRSALLLDGNQTLLTIDQNDVLRRWNIDSGLLIGQPIRNVSEAWHDAKTDAVFLWGGQYLRNITRASSLLDIKSADSAGLHAIAIGHLVLNSTGVPVEAEQVFTSWKKLRDDGNPNVGMPSDEQQQRWHDFLSTVLGGPNSYDRSVAEGRQWHRHRVRYRSPTEMAYLVEEMVAAEASQNWSMLRAYATQLLKAGSTDKELYIMRGTASLREGNWDDAIRDLEHYLSLYFNDPFNVFPTNLPDPYCLLASAYAAKEDVEGAQRCAKPLMLQLLAHWKPFLHELEDHLAHQRPKAATILAELVGWETTNDPGLIRSVADAYADLLQWDDAIRGYKILCQREDATGRDREGLLILHLAAGNRDEYVKERRGLLASEPGKVAGVELPSVVESLLLCSLDHADFEKLMQWTNAVVPGTLEADVALLTVDVRSGTENVLSKLDEALAKVNPAGELSSIAFKDQIAAWLRLVTLRAIVSDSQEEDPESRTSRDSAMKILNESWVTPAYRYHLHWTDVISLVLMLKEFEM